MVLTIRHFAAVVLCVGLAGCAGTGGLGRLTGTPLLNSIDDAQTAAPGTTLAFGEIRTTCGVDAASLGRPIGAASGYTIYDTNPSATSPRTHYIDGFTDTCVRQFTAALVLTGDVGTHELIRYEAATKNAPYSTTDNAYETIKGAYCGAPAGQACGAKLDSLARRTTFITAYPQFSGSRQWVEYLLHEGVVAGTGIKTN